MFKIITQFLGFICVHVFFELQGEDKKFFLVEVVNNH